MEEPGMPEIRQALRDAMRGIGLRAVGREVGMSPAGLRNVIDGANPHPSTRRKLQAWYVQNAAQVKADAGHAALDLLAEGVAPELRSSFRERVSEVVGELHGEAGLPLPAWVGERGQEAHAAGQGRRARRFATVEVAGAEPVVLVRPPMEGDPRAVAEAIATERGVWNGDDYYPPHRVTRVRLGPETVPGAL